MKMYKDSYSEAVFEFCNFLDIVKYTSKPNTFLLNKFFDEGIITLDYTLHLKDNGKTRDHGYLFRTEERYFNLIFPEQQIFDLETLDKSKYPY